MEKKTGYVPIKLEYLTFHTKIKVFVDARFFNLFNGVSKKLDIIC